MLTLVDAKDGKVQNILVSSLSNFLEHFENLAEIQNRQNFPQPDLEKFIFWPVPESESNFATHLVMTASSVGVCCWCIMFVSTYCILICD